MTIDCTIDIGWMREGQVQYGANVQFNLPAQVGNSVVAVALLESLLYAFEEMHTNATDNDRFGVEEKVLNITVTRGERCARFAMNHKRDDDEQVASDAVIDWVCSESVREVVR